MKISLNDLYWKIDYEGGLGEAVLYYFGREVNSVDENVNQLWREAYDALARLDEAIPECNELDGDDE